MEHESSSKVKTLLNAFEGTEIYEILKQRAEELNLLSNPDDKILKHLKKIEQDNEWGLRV